MENKFNNGNKKPELLAPAGDLEKLMTAVVYGADAVYMGGQNYGLRAKAKNFTANQMEEGIDFAHSHGAKVYVTANIFAHNADIDGMAEYFKSVWSMGADALIISDPGVFLIAREAVPEMNIHISTQANNTNYKSAMFWQRLGASRIVAARELSLDEIRQTRNELGSEFEIEAFVHGAMCISYSGRCLLSNYMSGRDSNRGECSQPCRWNYNLVEEKRPGEYYPVYEDERGTFIFNSKDLCMLAHLPELVAAGIDSFKIEGRMKTVHYVASVVKTYRQAIDDYFTDPGLYESRIGHYLTEISKSSHRGFTTGFYLPGAETDGQAAEVDRQIYGSSSYTRDANFVGVVRDYDKETGLATVEQRNKFIIGDEIEILTPKGAGFTQTLKEMYDEMGLAVSEAPHPRQILRIRTDKPVKSFDLITTRCLL